jgi:type VI secretion system protein ImpE
MSDALSALKAGQLDQALQLLQQDVRKQPADPKLRIFLFQVLAVLGQWDRALTQLGVIAELDDGALHMVHAYRETVRCERWREEVFGGTRAPLLFGTPEAWMAQLVEALGRDADAAAALRAAAFEQAPAISGAIDGVPFAWLADADPRIGPMIELIANGNYYWVPMQHIAALHTEAPCDLRDQVWLPATLSLTNGGELLGFIPSRYPGTLASGKDALLLARATDWVELGASQFGLGQRVFATDSADYALLDTRAIVFDHPSAANAAPAGIA